MRSTYTFLLLMSCIICTTGNLNAQHIRIAFTGSILQMSQSGIIYQEEYGHPTPLYYTPARITRSFKLKGGGVHVWYSLNFGKVSFEKFAYGIETGVIINEGVQYLSIIKPEKVRNVNVRIPLLFGARIGAAKAKGYGKWGLGAMCGLEIFQTSLADESGTFVVPKIQALIGRKYLFVGVGAYPFPVRSVYIINGAEEARMETSLFEIQARLEFNCIPKRYKANEKQRWKREL